MKITYDPKYNIAYSSLKDKKARKMTTIHLSDEVNVDIAPDGTIYGIELLSAKKQLKGNSKSLSFAVSNTLSKKTIQVPLSAK